VHPKTKTK